MDIGLSIFSSLVRRLVDGIRFGGGDRIKWKNLSEFGFWFFRVYYNS